MRICVLLGFRCFSVLGRGVSGLSEPLSRRANRSILPKHGFDARHATGADAECRRRFEPNHVRRMLMFLRFYALLRILVFFVAVSFIGCRVLTDCCGTIPHIFFHSCFEPYFNSSPIVTGSSVLAIKYKDGVMMMSDTLGMLWQLLNALSNVFMILLISPFESPPIYLVVFDFRLVRLAGTIQKSRAPQGSQQVHAGRRGR